ncbi:hypothetical protein [Streptomyces sp. NPDC047974]|uniref:hypothetical protein n=1 Tax=Streptomyces sp. NPDC047974 TaxID=3154343 RepID=UPI0033E9800A
MTAIQPGDLLRATATLAQPPMPGEPARLVVNALGGGDVLEAGGEEGEVSKIRTVVSSRQLEEAPGGCRGAG